MHYINPHDGHAGACPMVFKASHLCGFAFIVWLGRFSIVCTMHMEAIHRGVGTGLADLAAPDQSLSLPPENFT